MKIEKAFFGRLNGHDIHQYTLANPRGMAVKITNYGATVTSILLPGQEGPVEVACGFDALDGYLSADYLDNAPYFGSTIGRYCAQIKDARFSLNGTQYSLQANAGHNNLHGGKEGFDKKIWAAEIVEDGLRMRLRSPHLDEGFPGNVLAEANFALVDGHTLVVRYQATTDRETPLSMANHTYFNLSGFAEDVGGHVARVHSRRRLALDETGAATGEAIDVSGRAEDLRAGKRIGEAHQAMQDGFEHFYLFDNPEAALMPVAAITHQGSGRRLEVHTTEPCMLLYTGKYTADTLHRENGQRFGRFRAFCCETHRYPNGPNIPGAPGTTTKPGEKFTSETHYKFVTNLS